MLYETAITSFILTFGVFTGGFLSFIIELAARTFTPAHHLWKIDLNLEAPRTAKNDAESISEEYHGNMYQKCEEDGNKALQDCLKAIEIYITEEPKKNDLKEAAKQP